MTISASEVRDGLDGAKSRVSVTGAWYMAPVSAPAPSLVSIPAAYRNLGYISEDGTSREVDRSAEDIRAWQDAAKIRSVVTEAGIAYTFTLLETNRDTIALYNGLAESDISADGTYTVTPSSTGGRRAFIFVVFDGDYTRLVWIPEGEVSEIGEQVFAGGEPIGYEVTIQAYASSKLGGGSERVFDPSLAEVAPPAPTA